MCVLMMIWHFRISEWTGSKCCVNSGTKSVTLFGNFRLKTVPFFHSFYNIQSAWDLLLFLPKLASLPASVQWPRCLLHLEHWSACTPLMHPPVNPRMCSTQTAVQPYRREIVPACLWLKVILSPRHWEGTHVALAWLTAAHPPPSVPQLWMHSHSQLVP